MTARMIPQAVLALDADEHLAIRTCECHLPESARLYDLLRCHCGWMWLLTGETRQGRKVWRLMHVREGAFGYAREKALKKDRQSA